MKTIGILNYEYPPLGGGAGVCTQYQAKGLAQLGYRVIVITTWFEGEAEYEKVGNLEIYRLKSTRAYKHKSNSWEKIDWLRKTKSFLKEHHKKFQFDLILGNFTILGGEVGYWLKKQYAIPYLIISHGHDIPWFFKKQMFWYHVATYFWIKKVGNFSDGRILLTQEMKENADKFFPDKKDTNFIIPNGCEMQNFYPDVSKKSSKFQILFVGRLVEQKDPMTFLQACRELKEVYNIEFSAHILGDGPLKQRCCQGVSDFSLQDVVVFHGWVDKKEMLEYYQSSHLQVITSLAEAMSIATLESLSTGQYILSTPVSGNTDVIQSGINGEFFDYQNASELAKKIFDFYQEKFIKNRYHVSEKFIETFRNTYSWETIIKKYDQCIQNILGGK